MHLVPTAEEVIALLRETGALRDGHFECRDGLHTDRYLETALAMRHYRDAKMLSTGLSRLIRANPELRAIIPELSIVAATPGGLPVAYGVCEVLQAHQVYWAEKPDGRPMRFRQYLEQQPDEKVLLVDDILRSGVLLAEAHELLQGRGAKVVGLAVLVHQPTPLTRELPAVPCYALARIEARYWTRAAECELCRRDIPLYRIGPGRRLEALEPEMARP